MLVYAAWLQAKQAGTLPAYQQSLVAGFQRHYGLDLRQYRLIATGLIKASDIK